MNKTELADAIAKSAGITKVDSGKAIDALIDAIKKELKKDGEVALLGFGTFSVNHRAARKGINPRTKEQIDIPAKKVAAFKASSKFFD